MIKRYGMHLGASYHKEVTGDFIYYTDHVKEKQKLIDMLLLVKNNPKQFIYKTNKEIKEWININV